MNKAKYEPNFLGRRKIVGVMGGSTDYPELTAPLGRVIAKLGCHLLTGAGDGVMAGVSESFSVYENREGLVIGIIRAAPDWVSRHRRDPREYAPNKVNCWVEVPIYTHLHLSSADLESRNHINVLTADVVVVLPGKEGTESEVELAMQYGTPVIFFLGRGRVNNNDPSYYTKHFPQGRALVAADITQVEEAISTYIST